MTVSSSALLLFLVVDPFGNIPFFIAALKNVDERRRTRIILRELLVALIVLVVFLFAGHRILSILQISEPALSAAGGTVLFLIAVRMVFPSQGTAGERELPGEPFIAPLAIPYVAGPSAIASVLLIMNREPGRWIEWLGALALAWFCSGVIISLSAILAKILGDRALIAIERLMGMLLVAISIQMLMTGIARFIASVRVH